MNTEHIIIVCAIASLLSGCAVGYWSGLQRGRATGWERCRWEIGMRQAAQERARRDNRGRFRKVGP
jgi:hypothetical protein